ncbi:MAG: 16S rRNA (guanine(527)-N(7))-methyltransferase RsmG [Pseudomonadota bacterium]
MHDLREAIASTDVSRETGDRFLLYAEILLKWNKRINLVSRSTLPILWHRHFADSLQLLAHMPAHARLWLDIGSGGGFPGLVVATAAASDHPDLKVLLVDSDARKIAFCREVILRLALNAQAVTGRIEHLDPIPADVISARAVASLPRLLELSADHGTPRTRYIFPKGADYKQEIAAAGAAWPETYEVVPSETDPKAVLLMFGG